MMTDDITTHWSIRTVRTLLNVKPDGSTGEENPLQYVMSHK